MSHNDVTFTYGYNLKEKKYQAYINIINVYYLLHFV